MNQKENATFIGFGNMGSAIVDAVYKKKCFNKITVIEPDSSKTSNLKSLSILTDIKISEEINKSKYVWICVKPQLFKKVSLDLKSFLGKDQILISIMAGITKNQIVEQTNHLKVVRIMPNTPAQISKGISVWNTTNNVNSDERIIIEQSFINRCHSQSKLILHRKHNVYMNE